MTQIALYLGAALAGVAFVVQQAANASLRGALGAGLWAAVANFGVGLAAILLVTLATRAPMPSAEAALRAPWYAWIGGLLATLYIVGSIFLAPRIGAAALIALIVLGQMLTALALDHFGALGIPVHAVSGPRLAGAALLVAGVGLLCAS